jgi:DNA-binding CsgD family transcriptional regulator
MADRNVELDKGRLDELIAAVFSNGPFYFYIIDFADMEIKYMSPLVKQIHGLDPETTTFQDILDQIHPDDVDFVSRAEKVNWDFYYNQIGPERYQNYKMSYCLRFRTTDGSYQLFNHQSMMLSIDEEGRMSKALNIHTNISHLTTENNYKISAIGMFGAPSYLNLDVTGTALPAPTSSLFTKRETEIIRLLSDGFTSEEIANKLFISLDTVKTHRKHIMRKSGCRNLGQLVTKCITNGLL